MPSQAAPGVGEDPDFVERFRKHRLRRWARGVRNGMSLPAMVLYRLGLSEEIRFRGATVHQSPNGATLRLVEDIWMRGEYDLPGFVPQAGWRVVDVGANVGIFAMLATSRGARVVAYEPDPDAFARLRANGAPFGVECVHAAVVGAPRDTVRLFRHPLRDTRNTLFGETGGIANAAGAAADLGFASSVDVPAVPITEVLAQPCDLLKVACEGAEFEMFAHAGTALRNAKRVVLELHGEMRTAHGGAAELLARVRDAGFTVACQAPYPGMSRRFMTAVRT